MMSYSNQAQTVVLSSFKNDADQRLFLFFWDVLVYCLDCGEGELLLKLIYL